MSEVQKPVEELVAAPAPAQEATETSAADHVVESTTEEAPAVATDAATETPAVEEAAAPETTTETAPAAKEVTPIEEGILGHKGQGLLKSFIFQKKFFWFGSEPVESKNLTSYLRGEKLEVASHNAAWSAHTGKGLLFFSKKATEKNSPAGIINLSEISDITEDGTVDFFFTINGNKHIFQAANLVDRDNWVATLKAKVSEAKEIAESVTSSEAYKTSHAALLKPTVGGAAAPKKEEKAEDKKEEEAEKKDEGAEVKASKSEKKSRSRSRIGTSRNSIFGAIPGFGKKEEKTEGPKEDVAAAPAVTEPVTDETAPVVEAPATEVPATEEVPVAAAATEDVSAATPVTEEEAVSPPSPPAEKSHKRSSIFNNLQSRFSHKKSESEAVAPAVPAKDDETFVSDNAPVISAVDAAEPLAENVESAAPAEAGIAEAPATNGETKTPEAPATTKADKRKSTLPWMTKKDKSAASDDEPEKPLSPLFAKIRATVKRNPKADKSAEKPVEPTLAEEKPEDKVPEEAVAAEAAPVADEPVIAEPVAAAPVSAPQVSATA